VPVLVHGVQDPGRVTTAEILAELGWPRPAPPPTCSTPSRPAPCFMPIETLAPRLATMLSLRRILGVRNSTHTLVKILQPFEGRRCAWCRTPIRNTCRRCWAATSASAPRPHAATPS
jgi:anthranilate phosphoribosyltransferase